MIAPEGEMRVEKNIARHRVTIVTHYGRHLDEIAAIWLVEKYATADFLKQYCRNNELWLGCGGLDFDDHRPEIVEAENPDCCATLIARALDIRDSREGHILRYVLKDDKRGPGYQNTLSKMVNRMNRFYMNPRMRRRFMESPECATQWSIQAIEAKYLENPPTNNFEIAEIRNLMISLTGFNATEWYKKAEHTENYEKGLFKEAESTFDEIVLVEDIPGTDLKLAVVQTENWQFPAVSRKHGIAAIVTKDSSGNVQIFTNQKFRITLKYVVQNLRFMEQHSNGKHIFETDPVILRANGYGLPCSKWYYFTAMEACMNGSLTNWMPPTELPLDKIVKIAKEGIRFAVAIGHKAKKKQRIVLKR